MKITIYSALIAVFVLTACSHKESIRPTDFKADEARSSIVWKGSAPTHFHRGAFKVAGNLKTDGKGNITGGSFTIPIVSISNFDLTNEAERDALLADLKSPRFFNVLVHPEASFHITRIEPYSNAASPANTMITGDFTMIGQTHSVEIPVLIKAEKDKIAAEGSFKLNRLQWGMNSFNDPKETLYILPDVEMDLKLYFKPSGL
ncbi:YceI family protein [Niabella drilacis]|uniref:Polyisoprenoid-binding protein YceI n=1 Tax=Niabella drilacis (strain DSM 25811 / CCM 8410 / CCUG 62505 / LMG 26954 / E90) TaxID=1285928 RepID=A0A1G6Y013_NIADE|nr:YceI family protein [Niabella drilacis]SDD83632.1 Polyisoprenoid-binding protein YceI [Niabella drilacis]